MTDVKITDLPAATDVAGGDTIVVVQNGVTKRATPDELPLGAAQRASLSATYSTLLPGVGSLTYDGNGNVTQDQDGTTYTYNGDGTVHTITRNGVTRTLAYNGDGTIASVA